MIPSRPEIITRIKEKRQRTEDEYETYRLPMVKLQFKARILTVMEESLSFPMLVEMDWVNLKYPPKNEAEIHGMVAEFLPTFVTEVEIISRYPCDCKCPTSLKLTIW